MTPLEALVGAVHSGNDHLARSIARGMTAAELRTAVLDLAARMPPTATDPEDLAPVLAAAAAAFRTTPLEVLAGSLRTEDVAARQVTCYAGHLLGLPYSAIGRYLGRDHSTVMYATNRVLATPRLRAAAERIVAGLHQGAA